MPVLSWRSTIDVPAARLKLLIASAYELPRLNGMRSGMHALSSPRDYLDNLNGGRITDVQRSRS